MKKTKQPIEVKADPNKAIDEFSSTEFELRNHTENSVLIHTETGGETRSWDSDENPFLPDTEDSLELHKIDVNPTYQMYE